jgi:hypothetical protein
MPPTRRDPQPTIRDSPLEPRPSTSLIPASPYAPIDSENGGIRSLELAPGKFDDDIEIRLVPATLNDDTGLRYEAHSHVWGTDMATRRAVVNGIATAVTSNLDCALRHLRFTMVPRIVWVDAIAIDQKNTQERNHQVHIMGKIYSTAIGVILWLGPVAVGDVHLKAILGAMQFHFLK